MAVKRAEDPAAEPVGRAAEGMGGLAKGLAIIEAFAAHGVQSAADAARASGATRAAARRCLLTLVDLGYVERIGREFRALPRLRNLGRGSNLRQTLVEESGPVLKQIRDQLNESISLAVLDGTSSLFVARVEAQHIVSTGVRVGGHLPAYCSATGRVLLSGLTDGEVTGLLGRKAYPRRTALTLVAPAAVRDEIRAARQTGFAFSDEELEVGMRALAVPVSAVDGRVVAALSVSAYSARVSRVEMERTFLPVLKAGAHSLGKRLGVLITDAPP